MDEVLKPVLSKSLLDDIVISSSPVEEHYQNIREVSYLVEKVVFTEKLEKCHLTCKEIKYLAFRPTQPVEIEPVPKSETAKEETF